MAEQQKQIARVIAKAWADESYKKRLIADPHAVLNEEGLEIPAGTTVSVVEDTESSRTLVIPAPPTGSVVEEMEERLAASSPALA